mmetsp:Transcript_49993/g.156481  ORF Transcript_49993/g.156481 Transcript_49993/m.156481 type:complete len:207 (+) Transcript_49993:1470-2090(+)
MAQHQAGGAERFPHLLPHPRHRPISLRHPGCPRCPGLRRLRRPDSFCWGETVQLVRSRLPPRHLRGSSLQAARMRAAAESVRGDDGEKRQDPINGWHQQRDYQGHQGHLGEERDVRGQSDAPRWRTGLADQCLDRHPSLLSCGDADRNPSNHRPYRIYRHDWSWHVQGSSRSQWDLAIAQYHLPPPRLHRADGDGSRVHAVPRRLH